jgi:hypothetical protein
MRKAIVLVMSFALSLTLSAQTPTTTTHCTKTGDDVDCTSTDNSAQIARQQAQDQAGQQAGAAVGTALGNGVAAMVRVHRFNKGVKKYCKQHQGETWTYRDAQGNILNSGQCN